MLNGPEPRRAVREMAAYSPPTAQRLGKLRLDFNENTTGCSPRVAAYLRECIDAERLAVYPDYSEPRARLAQHFGVSEEQLILTNGTDEAIHVFLQTYVDNGDEVVVLHPSYAMYKFYAELAGSKVREVPYRAPALSFPLEELLKTLDRNTRAVIVSNPNNPTGVGVHLEILESILRQTNAAVLIDEAYFEFFGVTALPLLDRYPNLFVSRTFSKLYGMAAMRLGVLFSQRENVAFLRKSQSPYSVNMLAALAACEAAADTEFVRSTVEEVSAARELLYQGLNRLRIAYVPSVANFVLILAGERAGEICSRLRACTILVRDRTHEIAGAVRITVGTRAQIARVLEELENIW